MDSADRHHFRDYLDHQWQWRYRVWEEQLLFFLCKPVGEGFTRGLVEIVIITALVILILPIIMMGIF